jgi:ribosomal protein L3 glutamine methyltransferase
MSEQPHTPAGLIGRLEQEFLAAGLHYGHGTDNALDEAAYLALAALELPPDAGEEELNRELDADAAARVLALGEKRIKEHIPVAYLVNKAWFCNLPFYVDERVLIPRSPLAELIEERFSPWLREEDVVRILDIGTGSGCIAITCALAFPHAAVDAVDVDEDALAVARENIAHYHDLAVSIRLLQSDAYAGLDDERYDLIIANPPYVSTKEMQELPPEYRHEPAAALLGGDDGLDVVRRILAGARDHLTDHGVLIVEVGNGRQAVMDAFPDLPFTWLDFERGGEGVFLLTAEQLVNSE